MIYVFPANGDTMTAELDTRFGRCKGFVAYNTETKSTAFSSNSQNLNAAQGAGIQAAAHVVNLNADVVFCGHCGPKAFKTLQAGQVKVVIGASGVLNDILSDYENGKLIVSTQADVEGHWV